MPNGLMMTLSTVIVVAVVTGLTRTLPFILFGGQKELPPVLTYLGQILPAAIMIILVVYCLRNISFTVSPFGFPSLFSVGVVVLIQLWKKNTFLSIIIGTGCYMLFMRIMP